MNIRDKLIQLLDMNFGYVEEMEAEKLADYLIENGVTVQNWISVKDKLPEKAEDVLMLFEHNMAAGFRPLDDENGTLWCAYTDDAFYTDCDEQPTHWMPLPETIKEK